MINLLVYVLILCLVFGLIYFIIERLPLPPPFGLIAQLVVGLVLILILLDLLLGGRIVGLPRLGP